MTAALEGCERSAARPGRTLSPGKTQYPLYRRLGGPQGRSGRAETLVPNRDSIPDLPAHSSVAIPTELPDPRSTVMYYCLKKNKMAFLRASYLSWILVLSLLFIMLYIRLNFQELPWKFGTALLNFTVYGLERNVQWSGRWMDSEGQSGSITRKEKILYFTAFILAVGPGKPSTEGVSGTHIPGVKWPGRGDDHLYL